MRTLSTRKFSCSNNFLLTCFCL
uniref:Uncharacterized protein n=1 Tax=Heterorhabditis bacteriophora TaxID=37862 RepID=A0A1I7WCR7_HETBA